MDGGNNHRLELFLNQLFLEEEGGGLRANQRSEVA